MDLNAIYILIVPYSILRAISVVLWKCLKASGKILTCGELPYQTIVPEVQLLETFKEGS